MAMKLAAAAVLVGLLAGCGGDGGGSYNALPGASIIPAPDEQTFAAVQVPRAAAAGGAVDLASDAATHVLLDPFTDGEASGAPHLFLSPPEFQFSFTQDLEIDLDSEGRMGDRFPHLSGLLLVSVDASLAGTPLAGEAAYAVNLEAGSDITAVDPDSGIEVLIPQGATWSCSLSFTWDRTDSQNWIVIATATRAVEVEGLVVTDGDAVTTVSVSGGRQVTTGIARIDGELVREREVEGSFTITIDDGVNVATVLIEFDIDGLITVTIGDDVFGPFTPQEFREFFQVQFA